VKEIHEALLKEGIHGGKNIKNEFPELGETALYCVTEIHSKNDIDQLVYSIKKILEES
jgi:glycine dehydrogenase subunit 1